jgi:hypothetical protein
MAQAIVGVFESVAAAEQAKTLLTASGVAQERIALSADLVKDGIAAEAPGQSYEHQSSSRGADEREAHAARYGSAVRSGACVLSVSSDSREDRRRLARLLRQQGARVTMERPAL